MARVGVDVGGTNTDLVLEADHGVFFHKVASTPHDQSEGVLKGLSELCQMASVRPNDVTLIVHGTTVATNITIEHTGAEVGMLTSRNFRDILHIGRHKRPYNFSLHFEVPWQQQPLVRRRNRIAVTERILPPNGKVEIPLDEKEVLEAIKVFKRRGIKSVVIGFLFSFLNDTHERRAAEIVRAEMPDAYICTSSEVANVIREYERFSTAAMNAFVGPKTSLYLNNLQNRLTENGFRANLRVIQSNGGIATVETCSQKAVGILMSGPAGGVIGGRAEGILCGRNNLITVDIGGTSADISTIPDGRIKIMNARELVCRRASDPRADDRPGFDRRRRRLDRLYRFRRRLPCRPALGRRRAGPRLLRPWRHRADRHRCAGRSRPARRRQDARRRSAA